MRPGSYNLLIGIGLLLGPALAGASAPPGDLTSTGTPTAEMVARLVQESGNRDAVIREAVVRRLAGYPDESAAVVVEAFTTDRLAVRLAAYELLTLWRAPVRDMDPWRPETFDQDHLKVIGEWAATPGKRPAVRPVELTRDELASVGRDLTDLVRVRSTAEAQAIRERLARIGAALLPEVCARLKTVEDDQGRERLTALRYRLTASDDLALRWPSGFERLASRDAGTRQHAAGELGRFAGRADVPMLLELFSSPDALVREISLRRLSELGGAETTDAMVRLLGDPEPNVRAAVLKQWAERPVPSVAPDLAAFVARETDPDLVVHAVRALRAVKNHEAVACLMSLLKHPVWQVRAEAAEALGECIELSPGISSEMKADAYGALIGLLEDADGYIVSRVITALRRAELPAAVEPLVKAAGAHPELAADIVSLLGESDSLRSPAAVHLRSFCTHAEAAVRAAAVTGLGIAAPDDIDKEILATLADPEGKVRIAAADALFHIIDASRSPSQDRAAAVPFLERMLAAPQVDERVAACRPLVALGREELALPMLLAIARASTSVYPRTVTVLPWLPASQRRAFIDQLLRINPRGEALTALVSAIAHLPDENAAEYLWALLESPAADIDVGGQVFTALTRAYFGDDNYDPPAIPIAKRRLVTTIVLQKAGSGPPMQRLIALVLLLGTSPDAAAEMASNMFYDASIPESVRADTFQVLLLSQQGKSGLELAVANIAHPLVEVRRLALAYLSQGANALLYLRNRIWLFTVVQSGPTGAAYESTGDQIDLKPPERISPDALRRMLADSDSKSVAYAGYLLSLFGDEDGFGPLVAYWRTHAINDDTWTRLVYRAAAALNNEEHVPLLEDIYERHRQDDYSIREFYWTIQVMTGPRILKLQAKIRAEVGMDCLR